MASIYTEVGYSKTRPIDKKRIENKIIADLIEIGVIKSKKDIVVRQTNDIKFAYATYDKNRKRSVETINKFLLSKNIYSIGRYGRWEYSAMEDAILQGLDLAALLKTKKTMR
jgi:hypothetical protein